MATDLSIAETTLKRDSSLFDEDILTQTIVAKEKPTRSKWGINMMVLGGFTSALGIGTVAFALVALSPAVVFASVGLATIAAGVGLFAVGAITYKQKDTNSNPSRNVVDTIIDEVLGPEPKDSLGLR